jgi:hypothetical protein
VPGAVVPDARQILGVTRSRPGKSA